MSTTTAKLASAKLNDANGIPDDTAEKMYHALGSKHMAIVELEVFERTEGLSENANHTVRLRSIHLELASGDHATFLRELAHGLYTDRQPRGLDQVDEEDTDQIIERGKNVLLTCQACYHPRADAEIQHEAEDSEDSCTWKECGHVVFADTTSCTQTECVSTRRETEDLTGAIPVG